MNIPWNHQVRFRLDAQVPQGTKGVKFEEPVHEAMGEPWGTWGPIPVWNPWRSMKKSMNQWLIYGYYMVNDG